MEYGLIGEKLGHSFSKDIHNLIGDYDYQLKEIPRDSLNQFMEEKDFKAINVTIPYKQDVIPYLDFIDDAAKAIGAVNTIVNKDGKLFGYNTDYYGMKSLFEKINLDICGKNVLILGTGGTCKTASALVKDLGAKSICIVSRHAGGLENGFPVISYDEALTKTETNVIVNTTPCGMFPKGDEKPISLEKFSNLEGVVDAIYNPNCTELILEAKNRGLKAEGGLFMLVMQAVKAAEFFFGKTVDNQKALEIFSTILGRKENIVLVGMPSCGKTTVGKLVAKMTQREFIDCDVELVKKENRQISEIFAHDGEEYFRNLETQVIKEVSQKTGCVISTGGGAVLREENIHSLKKNGRIYFINRPLQKLLPTSDRPTANSADKIKKLFEVRYPIYKACADEIIDANDYPDNVAKKIIKKAGLENDCKKLKNSQISEKNNLKKQDIAVFEGKSVVKGTIKAPPSKSLAHRMLICAALAEGESHVTNVDFSQDILATLDCIKQLGAKVQIFDDSVKISGTKNVVLDSKTCFDCRESGSTLRFFIPMGMNFSKPGEKITFTGSKVLMTRPLSIYENLCEKSGILFEKKQTENGGKLEISRKNLKKSVENDKKTCEFGLKPGIFEIPGDISSQFITGLLFVLPLLEGDSEIKLTGSVESRSYINLTIQAMRDFEVKVEWKDETTLFVKGNQKYIAKNVAVEGDYSNAAFLDVFNFIGGNVQVLGLNEDSLQGDKVYKTMFESLKNGCPVLNICDCPDLGPILFVVAAFHNGATFTGTKRLAIKESNRGKIMCEELAKFGVKSEYSENQIVIKKSKICEPKEMLLGYNDHRIVMALSTLLCVTGGKINDAHAVSKSYPGYFDDISSLGVKVERL